MGDGELIEMARKKEPSMWFEPENASCKMVNEAYGAVFFFENNSSQTLICDFEL
jgi:hypothetical protein